MKTRFLLLIVAAMLCNTRITQAAKPVKAHLQHVTVYLQGAHLYYREQVTLMPGNNEFVFENISPMLNTTSLQGSSKGGVLMDIRHTLKYREHVPVVRKYDRQIMQVSDSLEQVLFELKNITNKLDVLHMERNMLLNSSLIKGNSGTDTLPALRDAIDFLHIKLNNIYELELKWERAQSAVTKKQKQLNMRYEELQQLQNEEGSPDQQPVNQVIVSVYSETGGTSVISFHYYIRQAGWSPVYNLQASSTTNLLQLQHFANVTQNSGLEWKQVPLTLSTSNPNESNTKPVLAPWLIHFRNTISATSRASMMKQKAIAESASDEEINTSASQLTMDKFVSVNETLIRTEYEIRLNYTIGNGQAHKVLVREKQIPMNLQFAAVPKLCSDAFLLGSITGWEDLNLIPGPARLYFDGAYVGETMLEANSATDTLHVNLGRDKTIVLARKKVKEKSKIGFLDNDKVETHTIELTVRNTKAMPVEIVLEDQIPVSQSNNEIRVSLTESNGAELDEVSGTVAWRLKLNSKETKKIRFTYEVRYPKTKAITGL